MKTQFQYTTNNQTTAFNKVTHVTFLHPDTPRWSKP
jgi:hypothetical protein